MSLPTRLVIPLAITITLVVPIFTFLLFYLFWLRLSSRGSFSQSDDGPRFSEVPNFPGDSDFAGPDDSSVHSFPVSSNRRVSLTVGESNAIESSTVPRGRKLVYVRGKECSVMTYLNKVLRVLFTVFALLTIILSVVLDNSYNDRPLRFIPFGILAPFTIFFGFLASGWFPRIPLRFIASAKRRGFLKHVMPCSPWHDNVLTNFCGKICTLKPMVQAEVTPELPHLVQNFLYGDPVCPQATAITQSALNPESEDSQVAESTLDPQTKALQDTPTLDPQTEALQDASTLDPQTEALQDTPTLDPESQDLSMQDSEDMSGTMQSRPVDVMATGQVSSPNLQEAPSQVEETIVQIDHSSMFWVSDQECSLIFKGPTINGFSLEVQAFKNTYLRDTFELSYTFRNTKTKSMYLNTRRLHNLAQNILRWVENPHPIVAEESSGILHCMAIQDILWEFTKSDYTLKSVQVLHRYLAGMKEVKQFATMLYVAAISSLGLIPLISDKKSLWFLFLVIPIVIRLLIEPGHLICYYLKTLLCPIFIKVCGFNKLYKSRSFFIWCNEFRKQRVVNPAYFLISQECSNSFVNRESCFEVSGLLLSELTNSPPHNQSFIMTCQGWQADRADPADPSNHQQHAYKLVVIFDSVRNGCYINVRLLFLENDDLLDSKDFFGSTEIQRLQLVEKLFNYYSDPSFGGYVETICPSFRSYLAHCPRFLDVCANIITEDTIPTLLVVARKPKSSDIIIGDSFISSTNEVF